MSDKFSLYQTDGLWGIIENASNEKQTSIKSYFGSDLIIKRLNEQAKQIDQLKQQLEEKGKEIERLKKNHLISYTNQKKAYENLKNSMNTKSLIKYPKRLDGCLIKNEQQLLDYAKESTLDIKYLRNNQTQLAIQELEKLKASADKWFDSWENSKYEGNIYDKLDVSNAYLQMSCEIDQQIKELKGEKECND